MSETTPTPPAPGQAAPPAPNPLVAEAQRWAREAAALLEREGDAEGAKAVRAELQQDSRGRPVVIVAGEDKRGKSSVVNALLRRPGLSPVGVEVVTGAPITFYRSAQDIAFVLYYGDAERHTTPFEDARAFATVQGNPGNERNVRNVTLGIDSAFLTTLSLVDTPGVGGLESGHAALTLQRLKGADAMLFILEAGAQIRGEELRFLERATSRIDRVIFVLTKIDLHRGWKQILEDNRSILRDKAPRFADCPIVPVSSTLALRANNANGVLNQELWKETGFAELERTIIEQVGNRVGSLRAANILRAGLTRITDLERLRASRVEALGSPHEAQQAVTNLQNRLADLNRERTEWPMTMQVELRRLGLDRGEELARGVLVLRNRYETRLKDLKVSEHDTLPGELVADLTAIAAEVNEWTQQRVVDLVLKLVGESDDSEMIASSLRQISDTAFAEELASISMGDVDLDTTEKISVVQSYSSGHSMASLIAIGGMTLIAAPIALGIGVVAGGMMAYTRFKSTKQSNYVQEFKSWMSEQIQRAQITVNNAFQRAQIDLEVGIRDALREAFAQRENEIRESIAACQQAMQQDQTARQVEKQQEMPKLQQIRAMAQSGLAVLDKTKS